MAQFPGNILDGSKEMSLFELVRGYTPDLDGTGMNWVPKEFTEAHKEMWEISTRSWKWMKGQS